MSYATTIGHMRNHTEPSDVSFIENAMRIARRADISPSRIKAKLIILLSIIGIASCVAVINIVAIGIGLPNSEHSRILVSFMILGSFAVILAAGIGIMVVLWTAYVYQYVKALDAKVQEADVIDLVPSLFQATTTRIAEEKSFQQEIGEFVLSQLEAKGLTRSRELRFGDIEVVIKDPAFGKMIAVFVCKRFGTSDSIASYFEKSLHDSAETLSLSAEQHLHETKG